MSLINPKNDPRELTTTEIKNPNYKFISKFPIISLLHKSPRHIIQSTTEKNVNNTNKTHPASISLLLSWIGASVAPSQDNLNLLLCLHLATSLFRSFNCSLWFLKSNILIFYRYTSYIYHWSYSRLKTAWLFSTLFGVGISSWSLRL